MHESTFLYLKPTEVQLEKMDQMRSKFKEMSEYIDFVLPDGNDKEHVVRLIRDAAMWANISITRHDDGAPRN